MTQARFSAEDLLNLFDKPLPGNQSLPVVTLAKIEGDTFDAVFLSNDGMPVFYKNEGDIRNPKFVLQEDNNNPFRWMLISDFDGVDYPGGAPEFVDINGDGRLDLFVSGYQGNVFYFENDPVKNGVQFPFGEYVSNEGNPDDPITNPTASTENGQTLFGLTKGQEFDVIRFADIDGDGLVDLFIGRNREGILFYKNEGTLDEPAFVQRTGAENPFTSFNAQIAADPARNRLVPAFVDFDRDGDLDVFVGQDDGTIRYLKNIGSATNSQFEEQFGSDNPFNQFNNLPSGGNSIRNGTRVAPYFADLTADGFAEAIVTQDDRSDILSFEQFPKTSFLKFENNQFVLGNTDLVGNNLQFVIGGKPASQIANIKIQIIGGGTEKLFSILPGGFIPRNFVSPDKVTIDFADDNPNFQTGSSFVISLELFGSGGTTTVAFDNIIASEQGVWTLKSSRSDLSDLSITLSQTRELPGNNGLGVGLAQSQGLAVFELKESAIGTFRVYREATFTNQIGLYRVDNALTGAIGSLLPGSEGYAQTAIRNRVNGFGLSVANQSAGSTVTSLTAGAYVPFMVVNGTFDSFLSSNPDNAPGGIQAYFPFLNANPDGQVHAMVLGNNTFGFEDLFGGGDFDYNDLIVQVDFA